MVDIARRGVSAWPLPSGPSRLFVSRHLVLIVALWHVACWSVLWWVWSQPRDREAGDTSYYFNQLTDAALPIAETMPEYPVPALWVLEVPRLLTGSEGGADDYRDVFIGLCFLAMAAFSVGLWQVIGRISRRAAAVSSCFWAAFTTALGTISLLRLDVLIAVAIGAAVLLAARRPATAGGLLAVAGWLKVWPVALLIALIVRRDREASLRTLLGFATIALAVGSAVLTTVGWTRTVSPLTYQSDRGLQVESLWATPLLLGRLGDPSAFPVRLTEWKAFEIFGQGREASLMAANVATIVLVAVVVAACWVAWRGTRAQLPGAHPTDASVIAGLAVLVTLAVLLANKTFSPQYLVWLGGPMAVALAWSLIGGRVARTVRWGGLTLFAAVATFVVYPFLYGDLTNGYTPDDVRAAIGWLLARNLALVVLFIDVAVCSFIRRQLPAVNGV